MALLTQGCSFFQSNFTLVGFILLLLEGEKIPSDSVLANRIKIKIRTKIIRMPENCLKNFIVILSRITLPE